jgi:large conductance mechanosensitive channel
MDGANVVSPEVAISYGLFINTLVNFLIIMFSIFLMLKVVNQITKKKEATPTGPTKDQELLTEIRDILKGKSKAK